MFYIHQLMESVNKKYNFPKLLTPLILLWVLPFCSPQTTRRFEFNVAWTKVTRLCFTKQLLTVNGKYPGPTIAINEGDSVEIKVTNNVSRNTTIHWHGIRQLRTGWADGPAYVTQCPIRPRHSYTYKFTVSGQRGTLFWHAHYAWQRASVHGAFIIYPRFPYPFSTPIQAEVPIIFGEWWNLDTDEVERGILSSGGAPAISLAFTINGMPGPYYPCSYNNTFIQTVEFGKTYMLRIINAALQLQLFFAISNHTLTVVEVDSVYTKPFTTKAIMIAPGQTTTVLITANQVPDSTGMFPMAVRPYYTLNFPFNNSTAIGFLKYKSVRGQPVSINPRQIRINNLPKFADTEFMTKFSDNVRSLASQQYPCDVPKTIDKRVVTTISLNLQDCPANRTCTGFSGKRFFASMSNQSFVRPSTSILESYYWNNTSEGIAFDFPENPPNRFDYTGGNPLTQNMNTEFGTKLLVVPYGAKLEIVFQDTSFITAETHPIHVHGHNFFIVGTGFGNFNETKDPENYNLVDPPERNTVAVPSGGWSSIRINADNPGVWFVHCHLEDHTSWGLAMAFIVQNGPWPSQTLLPPPQDLPSC